MGLTYRICSVAPRATWTQSSREPSRATSRSSNLRSLRWSSISRPRKHSASRSRRPCYRGRTRSSSKPVLDQRGQLLRAAVGFAGCSMPSYDRALDALRTWLDSWSGIGHVVVGMVRQGFDLQLTRYDEKGMAPAYERD